MDDYRDILDRPRPPSKHKPMAREARAAQFAPFAALTGYDAAVQEEARLTDRRRERSDEQNDALNRTLAILADNLRAEPPIAVTYFLPDGKKDGGAYTTVHAHLRRIDGANGMLLFRDGGPIPLADVLSIELE